MDDGEIDPSLENLTGNSSKVLRAQSKFEDSLLDDTLIKKRTCTQTHTDDQCSMKPERPLGNRVAVRKYREKKKAQNAYLEEEVKKLRMVNRGLIRKLQIQAALEAEAVRLRRMLTDMKARIGKELDVSSFYQPRI